ncbi:hypothetical protein RI367_007317 [Sorochytrium milnesiophthora]
MEPVRRTSQVPAVSVLSGGTGEDKAPAAESQHQEGFEMHRLTLHFSDPANERAYQQAGQESRVRFNQLLMLVTMVCTVALCLRDFSQIDNRTYFYADFWASTKIRIGVLVMIIAGTVLVRVSKWLRTHITAYCSFIALKSLAFLFITTIYSITRNLGQPVGAPIVLNSMDDTVINCVTATLDIPVMYKLVVATVFVAVDIGLHVGMLWNKLDADLAELLLGHAFGTVSGLLAGFAREQLRRSIYVGQEEARLAEANPTDIMKDRNFDMTLRRPSNTIGRPAAAKSAIKQTLRRNTLVRRSSIIAEKAKLGADNVAKSLDKIFADPSLAGSGPLDSVQQPPASGIEVQAPLKASASEIKAPVQLEISRCESDGLSHALQKEGGGAATAAALQVPSAPQSPTTPDSDGLLEAADPHRRLTSASLAPSMASSMGNQSVRSFTSDDGKTSLQRPRSSQTIPRQPKRQASFVSSIVSYVTVPLPNKLREVQYSMYQCIVTRSIALRRLGNEIGSGIFWQVWGGLIKNKDELFLLSVAQLVAVAVLALGKFAVQLYAPKIPSAKGRRAHIVQLTECICTFCILQMYTLSGLIAKPTPSLRNMYTQRINLLLLASASPDNRFPHYLAMCGIHLLLTLVLVIVFKGASVYILNVLFTSLATSIYVRSMEKEMKDGFMLCHAVEERTRRASQAPNLCE